MQVKLLEELANITFGYTFREAIVEDPNGDMRVIQARNISSEFSFQNSTELLRVSVDSTRSSAFVKRGEILMTTRGATVGGYKACMFDADSDLPVLASSSLFILHSISQTVLPEYLVAYLNSDHAQRELQDKSTGATVRSIPRGELEKLKIPIPPMEKQKSIIALQQNIKQQNKLLNQRLTINNQIIDTIIKHISN